MRITRIALTMFAVAAMAVGALGQERKPLPVQEQNQYLVSVRAGIVNLAEGDVTYKRADKEWEMLLAGDSLQPGDVVRTGADSRAEILLNPGSYLRLANNSEFVFTNTALDKLKLHLVAGSAIIEAVAVEGWKGTILAVTTPQSVFGIVKGGLYRFNVEPDKTEALVLKGRLVYADTKRPAKDAEWLVVPEREGKAIVAGSVVKDGKKAVVESGNTVVAAFNKKDQDQFDAWSKDRAKVLLAANQKISVRALRRTTVSASAWFYNPFLGCYTFLPGWYGYRSPYGGYYGVCNWRNNLYNNPYYQPKRPGELYGGGNTGGGGNSGGNINRPPSNPSGGFNRGDRGQMPGNPRTGVGGGAPGRNRDH